PVAGNAVEAGRSFYRYAGLYRIARYWAEPGRSGPLVWRFRLEELPELPAKTSFPESTPRDQPSFRHPFRKNPKVG
ncbi:hypothetical protein EON80_19215, partial [bacterium]